MKPERFHQAGVEIAPPRRMLVTAATGGDYRAPSILRDRMVRAVLGVVAQAQKTRVQVESAVILFHNQILKPGAFKLGSSLLHRLISAPPQLKSSSLLKVAEVGISLSRLKRIALLRLLRRVSAALVGGGGAACGSSSSAPTPPTPKRSRMIHGRCAIVVCAFAPSLPPPGRTTNVAEQSYCVAFTTTI